MQQYISLNFIKLEISMNTDSADSTISVDSWDSVDFLFDLLLLQFILLFKVMLSV